MTQNTAFPRTKRVGILVFPDFEPLDVWGFVEAFAISRFIGTSYATATQFPFEIFLVSNETGPATEGAVPAKVKSMNGPFVAPDLFRDQALADKFDLFMIPGGKGVFELLPGEPTPEKTALLDWVCAMNENTCIMSSVCTGAAILASAGLLDGVPAATNHMAFAQVAPRGPKVLWDNVSRWVDAGNFVTSAGVSAGTDMAFHLVARMAGRAVAETSAMGAEYDWHRDPQQPIFYPQQATVPDTPPR